MVRTIDEKRILIELSKYGFFNNSRLNDTYLELSKEFFPLTKGYLGGYFDKEVLTEASLFLGNMDRDAMIMLFNDFLFTSNTFLNNSIKIAGRNLNAILSDLDKYQIKLDENQREGIYYFNHNTGIESVISFKENFEIEQSKNIFLDNRQIKRFTLTSNNPIYKAKEILRRWD